jgi:hypothetical protein
VEDICRFAVFSAKGANHCTSADLVCDFVECEFELESVFVLPANLVAERDGTAAF